LNAIETYIPWNFHETYQNKYDFTGARNFSRFFELAAENELVVIVRPGPYICAEWENGGLPYWLLKFPNIKQRSSDTNFLRETLAWWDVLLPMIRPYLWKNNGPVIMVQIENEYGGFGCDHDYLHALRDKAVEKLGNDTTLFTSAFSPLLQLFVLPRNQTLPDILPFSEGGPRVNSELYPGWYRTWGEKGIERDISASLGMCIISYSTLAFFPNLYNMNASFNYYMFHGGTNFGFWNGAEPPLQLITSYDYFAPMTENGGYNDKYKAIRDFISGIKDWPNPPKALPVKPHHEHSADIINVFQGIIAAVTLDGAQLMGWTSCPVDVEQLANVSPVFNVGDVFRSAPFTVAGAGDSFIDVSTWGKGVVWLNEFNLGRYWGTAGPQVRFILLEFINSIEASSSGMNVLTFLELEKLASDCSGTTCNINLLDHPLLYK
uniref:Glyco_hydro_35 domain-containing protein n=1 Tax=Heligmosomoides polygyrus TaxID=6339 RepID=A0A183FN17_HELPZ